MKASDYTKAKKGWIASVEAWYSVSVPNVQVVTHKDKRGIAESFDLTYSIRDKEVTESIPAHQLLLMTSMPNDEDLLMVSFTRVERTAEFSLAEEPTLTKAGLLKLTRHPDRAKFYAHPSRAHLRKK